MLGTGLALVYRLPPRVRGGGGLTMLGMDRHQWGDLHFYTGVALGILVVVHVLLHWGWVKRAAGALRFRLGWILLLLGLAIVAVPLVLPVS